MTTSAAGWPCHAAEFMVCRNTTGGWESLRANRKRSASAHPVVAAARSASPSAFSMAYMALNRRARCSSGSDHHVGPLSSVAVAGSFLAAARASRCDKSPMAALRNGLSISHSSANRSTIALLPNPAAQQSAGSSSHPILAAGESPAARHHCRIR